MLASAIGAASSRLVLSLLLRKRTVSTKAALKLLDDANAAIQYNREILQTALDHVRQGIAVFDKDLQLICWNRQFGEILDLPPSLIRVGIGLAEILRFNAERGDVGAEPHRRRSCAEQHRALRLRQRAVPRALRRARPGDRGARQPHAGRRHRHHLHRHHRRASQAAEALERANETLERRVRERTEELTRLNAALRAPRPRPTRPTSPRRGSSPPRATTSCSRSTRRGSTSPA